MGSTQCSISAPDRGSRMTLNHPQSACLESVSSCVHLRRIRFWLAVFMAGLVLSGITAFPLEAELRWLAAALHAGPVQRFAEATHLPAWIERVKDAVGETNLRYPFLAYGTDWLAFAHLVIAVAFVGPYIDPVRNK